MIDLILKIFALASLVFVWGFAWTSAADKDEKAFEDAQKIKP